MPLMARYIYADGVSPSTLVFLRNFLALPSLALLAYIQRKSLKVPVKALAPITALSFFGCCLTPILLFTAYNYIASGTATGRFFTGSGAPLRNTVLPESWVL